jgi:hypothetical protein
MFRNIAQQSESSEPVRATEPGRCRADAIEFHEQYESNFPIFWRLIDDDKEKLATIFEFFCAMQKLMFQSPMILIEHLMERLSARYDGRPLPDPTGFLPDVERFSTEQVKLFRGLGALVRPAFELFAAGALSGRNRQFRRIEEDPAPAALESMAEARDSEPADDFPQQPDGGAFFFWAEFGLLAAKLGFETEDWKEVLPVLLRAERIFALCYGTPVDGHIPSTVDFNFYNPRTFSRIHPDVTLLIPYPSNNTLEELEAEATACARFAFPGGI